MALTFTTGRILPFLDSLRFFRWPPAMLSSKAGLGQKRAGGFNAPVINLMDAPLETQEEVCFRFGVAGVPPSTGENLGIAFATVGKLPINGLRVRRKEE